LRNDEIYPRLTSAHGEKELDTARPWGKAVKEEK
jgi:hypothetical protein